MFFLVFSVLSVLIGCFCMWRYLFLKKHKSKKTDYDMGAMFWWAAAIFFLVFSVIATAVVYSGQIKNIEEIVKFERLEAVYEEKAKSLTVQFENYLAKIYPEHEKDVFGKISPEKVDIYLVKYPELRSSETLVTLVNKIQELQTDRYYQRIQKEEVLKDIRFQTKNPWVWNFLIPRYEESL